MADFPGGTPRPRGSRRDRRRTGRSYLENRDGHTAWVNSAALELAGIDGHTPDPADGRIERDPDGTPTGTLHEGAHGRSSSGSCPETRPRSSMAAPPARPRRTSTRSGITAWQDAIVEPGRPRAAYRALADAAS